MSFFKTDERLEALAEKALENCEKPFKEIDSITEYNT